MGITNSACPGWFCVPEYQHLLVCIQVVWPGKQTLQLLEQLQGQPLDYSSPPLKATQLFHCCHFYLPSLLTPILLLRTLSASCALCSPLLFINTLTLSLRSHRTMLSSMWSMVLWGEGVLSLSMLLL